MPKLKNLTNQKFNNLTVLSQVSNSISGRVTWLCLCNCGNQCKVTAQHLTRAKNPVKSCGCLKYTVGSKSKQWTGYKEISGTFWKTRVTRTFSKRNKIPVDITIKYGWDLYIKQNKKCALSGLPLFFPKTGSDRTSTISLDRIDSSKGYIKGNVQWVHKDINMMKRIYDQKYFIEMCKLVAKNCVKNKK